MFEIVKHFSYSMSGVSRLGSLGEDPFNETLLLSTICALKNVPLVPSAVKKRKRRPRPPPKRHVYLHREFLVDPPAHYKEVPAGDPRLQIPRRIMDTFAGGDFNVHASVMREVCDPQLHYYMQYDGKQNPYGPNRREFIGLEEQISLNWATLQSCPDCVPQIYDGPHVYYDETTNESFASYKVLTSMTKVGVIKDRPEMVCNELEYTLSRLPAHLPMVTSYMCAKFTYAMNSQNKITKYCVLFKQMMYDPDVKRVPGSMETKKKDNKKQKTK